MAVSVAVDPFEKTWSAVFYERLREHGKAVRRAHELLEGQQRVHVYRETGGNVPYYITTVSRDSR